MNVRIFRFVADDKEVVFYSVVNKTLLELINGETLPEPSKIENDLHYPIKFYDDKNHATDLFTLMYNTIEKAQLLCPYCNKPMNYRTPSNFLFDVNEWHNDCYLYNNEPVLKPFSKGTLLDLEKVYEFLTILNTPQHLMEKILSTINPEQTNLEIIFLKIYDALNLASYTFVHHNMPDLRSVPNSRVIENDEEVILGQLLSMEIDVVLASRASKLHPFDFEKALLYCLESKEKNV